MAVTSPLEFELEQANRTIEQQGKAITKLSEENRKLKNQLKWRDDLDRIPAKVMSQNHKAALSKAVRELQSREADPDGWILLDKTDEIAEDAGMSVKTLQRHLTYCKDLGAINKKIERVRDKDTELVVATKTYIKETELTPYPRRYRAQEERNHGGTRLRCKCGSEKVEKRVTYICTDCGEYYDKKPEFLPPFDPNDPQDQFGPTEDEHECGHEQESADSNIDPTTIIDSYLEPQDQFGPTEDESRKPNLTLLSNNYLSGQVGLMDEDESNKHTPHISASADHDSIIRDWLNKRRGTDHIIYATGSLDPCGKYKYADKGYQPDLDAFIAGDKGHIYGSRPLNAETGKTNLLCFEIDKAEQDAEAENYLWDLARAGASAVYWQRYAQDRQRGHLELYFDQSVDPEAARQWAIEICPDLEDIPECYPCKEPQDKQKQGLSWPLYQLIEDTVYPCIAKYMLPSPHEGGLQEVEPTDKESLAGLVTLAVTPSCLVEEFAVVLEERKALQQREKEIDNAVCVFIGQKPKRLTQVQSDRDLSKQVAAEQNDLHSWDEIAAMCGGWNNGFFKAIWRDEKTGSVRPDKDGRYACDYGNHGMFPKKLDRYEAYCLAKGIDKKADLSERCAEYRRQQSQIVTTFDGTTTIAGGSTVTPIVTDVTEVPPEPATELFPVEQKQGRVYVPCIVCSKPKSVKRADGIYTCGTEH